MTKSQEPTTATSKCFSAILRRLLCTGSLPTHPSGLITTTDPRNPTHYESMAQAPASPGVIPRLMGLDPLPITNWAPKQTTIGSILRSKSVNSGHYLPEFGEAHHRRVKTSVSFREVHQRNHDLFVLCLEEVGGMSKISVGVGKSEVELEQREGGGERKEVGVENIVNFPHEKKSVHGGPMCCYSENSSPVSVIDFHNTFGYHKKTSSEVSRKNSTSNTGNYDNPSSNDTRVFNIADDHPRRAKRNTDDDKSMKTQQYNTEPLSQICIFKEQEIKESNWIANRANKFEFVEEICSEFGQQILDLLFQHVIDQLVDLSCDYGMRING